MRSITLRYHDVVEPADHEASGFRGAAAASYKLGPDQFAAHLEAIARAHPGGPSVVSEIFGQQPTVQPRAEKGAPPTLFLTFDDGGESGYREIAPQLEARGWRGHFFVVVSQIGKPGFCDAEQLRKMAAKGHVIGSHSFSHQQHMSLQSWSELSDEWQRSATALAEILGEPPRVGAVPDEHCSRTMARAAARAGIRVLFTSEPVSQTWRVEGCRLLGRYTISRKTSAAAAAALAAGERLPRYGQFARWRGKQLLHSVAEPLLAKAKKTLVDHLPR